MTPISSCWTGSKGAAEGTLSVAFLVIFSLQEVPGPQLLKSSHLNGCFTVVNLPDKIWNSDIVIKAIRVRDWCICASLIYHDIGSLVKLCQ